MNPQIAQMVLVVVGALLIFFAWTATRALFGGKR